jgi:hypothetical protein
MAEAPLRPTLLLLLLLLLLNQGHPTQTLLGAGKG